MSGKLPGIHQPAGGTCAHEVSPTVSTQSVANHLALYDSRPGISAAVNLVATYAGLAHPVAILLGLSLAWTRQARIGELVTELVEHSRLDLVERTPARVLGDPGLAIGRWDAGAQSYLTATGDALSPDGPGRHTTYLEQDGEPMAAVVHDSALLDDGELLNAAGAAVRMAVDNDLLRAELKTQLAEVRASRSRIVVAADDERRRLERDLHDGAQQRARWRRSRTD